MVLTRDVLEGGGGDRRAKEISELHGCLIVQFYVVE